MSPVREFQSDVELEEECDTFQIISPPERLFYCAWGKRFDSAKIGLLPQFPIGRYFADFYPDTMQFIVNGNCPPHEPGGYIQMLKNIESSLSKRFVIEIDGHYWHERTPEQAEYDRRRERLFIKKGWTVLRYAAREVFRNPDRCVDEVYGLVKPTLAEAVDYIRRNWPDWKNSTLIGHGDPDLDGA